jgi:hypothetical protein
VINVEDIKDFERKVHHPKPPTLEQVIHDEKSNAHREQAVRRKV